MAKRQQPPAGETRAEESNRRFPLTKTVQEGEYLSTLILEVYGQVNDDLIEWVRLHNPHLTDVNAIAVGERIVFPALPEEGIPAAASDTQAPQLQEESSSSKP